MAIDNMTLPTLMADLGSGNFGDYEARQSHYGAVNILYRNASKLFGEKLMNQIQSAPPGRVITIPIFARQDHTVLTTRSCVIACPTDTTNLKTLTRTHIAVDICINPDDYGLNYVTMEQALQQRYLNAFRAVYTLLDTMGVAFFDTNKSTNMVADSGGTIASPLYSTLAGAYEFRNSQQMYSYLNVMMEQMDIRPPFLDLANTIAAADRVILQNPGQGTQLQTDRLLQIAGITDIDYSNRVAVGVNKPVHYIAPVGSVGVLNIIDPIYQRSPEIASKADKDQWAKAGNLSEVKLWAKTPDPIFPGWQWGVQQEISCVNEQLLYKVKFSADFCFANDFTSETGVTPIKKIQVADLYMPTYLGAPA